ncbi:hypothetical protein ACFQ1M_05670 [Sungkyunkwania multivorans]|uniref:DUF7452 domain-containing protein n=1 Tax=Sungkyunkwania multivorans TaxID=1173618 RepID=A0ABW3CVZ1_9FLAO
MRKIKKSVVKSVIGSLFMAIGIGHAQTAFKHVANNTNTKSHISSINHSATDGKSNMVLFVTHDYGKGGPYATKAAGVWYNGTKWTIFNQDRTPMQAKTQFNVLAVPRGSNAFVHKAGGTNMANGATKIDHRSLNGNPNANIIVTQNWGAKGPYNANPVGVYYAGGMWHIFNTNGKPIPNGAKFNVLVHKKTFRHKVGNTNKKNHITYINDARTNGKSNSIVLATFNAQNSRKNFNNPIGVWYSANKWTVYNEDRKPLKGNEAYNIIALDKKGTVLIKQPTDGVVYRPVEIKKDIDPKKPNTKGLKTVGLVRYKPIKRTDNSASSTEREGPDITKYQDIGTLLEGEQYESFLEKLNIFRKIYHDKNKNAREYYYFPAEYTLKWNKETNEYAFNIYYMSSEGGQGSVLINAELSPQISSEDIKLAEKLLAAKLRKPVKLMPMDLRDVPKVDFGATLTNFNVKAESINASIPSDYHKPIILDWRMDSNVDDFVGAMLNNIGVNLNLEFRPHGDETTVINVPINLEVNSPMTFGKIEFEKPSDLTAGWTNELDYPVVPKELVILRKQGSRNYFETISLDNEEIGKGDTYNLNNDVKNRIANASNIQNLWLDYSLNKDCDSCNQEVKRKIIGGTSGSQITNLEIQVLNALSYSDAHSMKLMIKSIQGDPNATNEITFPPMSITEDDQTLDAVQLFVPEGKDLAYDYQVIMIMKDGTVKTSHWKTGSTSLLVLGESQIKSLFKHLEKSGLEKAKDSVMQKGKDELIEKGKELLGGLFGKKKDKKDDEDSDENDGNEENENDENENL